MSAYYNEIDPLKAETIREAIRAGAVPPGDVDERSIKDVQPADVMGYTQCHWFAGGAFWSLALRRAGWPDDRPVWTGSCPCPSFSAAGKGSGFDDPRHLWPDWARLIRECRPATIFGEQVSAAVRYGWLDVVQANLEAAAYSVGAIVFGAHSVGAPHIRQRLYFVAHAQGKRECANGLGPDRGDGKFLAGAGEGRDRGDDGGQSSHGYVQRGGEHGLFAANCGTGERSLPVGERLGGGDQRRFGAGGREVAERRDGANVADQPCDGREDAGDRADTASGGHDGWRPSLTGVDVEASERGGGEREPERLCDAGDGLLPVGAGPQGHAGDERAWRGPGWLDPHAARSAAEAGATRGFWAGCDWWYGRDGKYRPIEPGIFPLASKYPARVGLLRLAGDAIVVEQAKAFIEAYLGTTAAESGRDCRPC